MTSAVSTSLWISRASAALPASSGPVASGQTNADLRALLAQMHVRVATVVILGLPRSVPADRFAETGRSQS